MLASNSASTKVLIYLEIVLEFSAFLLKSRNLINVTKMNKKKKKHQTNKEKKNPLKTIRVFDLLKEPILIYVFCAKFWHCRKSVIDFLGEHWTINVLTPPLLSAFSKVSFPLFCWGFFFAFIVFTVS